MAGENELIEISVLSGQSDRPTLTFTAGTPANPVSVGRAGQWTVSADGVGAVQLYLVFDGRSVHVAAAAPSAHVLLAGVPVGATWARAPIPCELRFGGACLILRSASRAAGLAEEERTIHDGGALWHAAQRAVQDAGNSRQPGASDAPPLGAQFPSARPAAGAPVNLSGTVPLDNQMAFREAVVRVGSNAPPPNAVGPIAPEDLPTTVRGPLGGGPLGAPAPGQEVTMIAPQPLMPRLAAAPPTHELEGAHAVGPPAPVLHGLPGMQGAPAHAAPRSGPPAQENTSPGAANPNSAKGYWQQASVVKRATLVLMPFALVMSYLMLQPEAAPPPPKVITAAGAGAMRATALRDAGASIAMGPTSATRAATTSDSGGGAAAIVNSGAAGEVASDDTGTAPTTATVDTKPDVPTKLPPLPAGKRTPERLALDAVAAGSFDEASKLYTSLATAHPDDPIYKEAARILREKSGQSK